MFLDRLIVADAVGKSCLWQIRSNRVLWRITGCGGVLCRIIVYSRGLCYLTSYGRVLCVISDYSHALCHVHDMTSVVFIWPDPAVLFRFQVPADIRSFYGVYQVFDRFMVCTRYYIVLWCVTGHPRAE